MLELLTEGEKKALKAVYVMWKSLDFSDMSRSRLMGIWDEFLNKIQFAAYARTPAKFLETFARKMGILNYADPVLVELVDEEVLKILREEPRTIVLALRALMDFDKERKKHEKQLSEEKKKLRERMEEDIKAFEEFLKEYRAGGEV